MRWLESRKGAVAWAMRRSSVSLPRSSNRTCGFPASGFPTGFIVRHTAAVQDARFEDAARRGLQRPVRRRTAACHVLAPCAACTGMRVPGRRRGYGPRLLVAVYQEIANLRLDPLHAPLGWACA